MNSNPGRCQFCGKSIGPNFRYCPQCRNDGLDAVHAITGRTNGWDRKPHAAGAVGGWRGQRRMGGGAAGRDQVKGFGP